MAWVGVFGCHVTPALLKALAKPEGKRVLIRRGGEQIAEFPNVVYKGPYRFPEGLAKGYRGVPFSWAQDLWRSGKDSDWLPPSRGYEDGAFGAQSLCVVGTETVRVVCERIRGHVLNDAHSSTLIDFVRRIGPEETTENRRAILTQPASDFAASMQHTMELLRTIMAARRSGMPVLPRNCHGLFTL